MKSMNLILPAAALGLGALLLVPAQDAGAYSLIGGSLGQSQRDFRVYNNFSDSTANNNTTADAQFPGYTGAVLAIWKGCIEWGSEPHGTGDGDPHQPGGLGSGGANFDPSFQGEALSVGTSNNNIHSELGGSSGGTLAFTETPISNGWRIRYYSGWTWDDGPNTNIGFNRIDLQGVACHEYGHALGLGHSGSNGATMEPAISGSGVSGRSINNDDQNGVKAIYGAAASAKPHIDDVVIIGNQITVSGSGFSGSGNQIWFTQGSPGGNGTPIKVTNLSSNGSSITATIPTSAGPGDILVRDSGTGHDDLSNAFPTDLQDTGGCIDPVKFCATSPNSVGPGALINSTGSSSLQANNLTVTCFGLPADQFGIFYYGSAQTATFFGDGLKCVAGGATGIVRLTPVQSDFVGDVSLPLDLSAPPFSSGIGQWQPGNHYYMQFWYRDPAAGGSGFNLSDALDFTVCP